MAFKKGAGTAGTERGKLVQMKISVPQAIRDAMQEIWHTKGYTISQQARLSLSLWVKAHAKDPDKADGLFAMSISPRAVQAAVEAELSPEQRKVREEHKAAQRLARQQVQQEGRYRKWDPSERQTYNAGHDPNYDPAKDPEPDRTLNEHGQHSAEWWRWQNRQDDCTLARLAKGIFRVPDPPKAFDWLNEVQYKPAPKPEPDTD